MFHLIPAPLHRLALRVGHRLRGWLWKATGRAGRAAILIALDSEGRVMLARHSYGTRRWTLPGGGLKGDEDAEVGLRREMFEEFGRELVAVRLALETVDIVSGAKQHGYTFTARFVGDPVPDGREIEAIGWFDPSELPAGTTGVARRRIPEALGLEQR